MKSVESVRTNATAQQAGSQLRTITTAVGHSQARVLSSSIQAVSSVPIGTTTPSLIGQSGQATLKPVTLSRTGLVTTCATSNTITLTQGSTPAMSPRPHVTGSVPVTSHTSASHISTTYHVPRGAAAVANIAAPRSAVATPIVRATTLQAAGTAHTTGFVTGIRAVGSANLAQRATSPATSVVTPGTMWLGNQSSQSTPTVTIPKSVSPRPLLTTTRTPVTTISNYTQGRTASMTVTARPITPQGNRIPVESPRAQILHSSGQKPITVSQTGTQLHIAEGSYFKSGVTVQSALSGVSIAQVLPARTQTPTTYSTTLPANSAPVQFSTPTTLIAHQTGTTRLATTVASQRPAVLSPPPIRTTASPANTAQSQMPARIAVAGANGGTTARITSLPTQAAVLTGGQTRLAVTPGQVATEARFTVRTTVPQARLTVSTSSAQARITVPANSTATTRIAVSSSSNVVPSQAHQGATVLTTPTQTRIGSAITPSMVSLHPVMVSSSGTSIPLKPVTHAHITTSANRTITTHQNISHKVIAQSGHAQSIQITQVPLGSKLPQAVHNVTPLQQTALTITTGTAKAVTYTTTTTIASSTMPGVRPVSVTTTPSIPVGKVYPQQVGVGRTGNLELTGTPVSEVALHTIPTQVPQQQTVVAAQQTISQATSVYIQTSHRASPAPTSTQVSVERTSAALPTYNLPATYYYEPTTIGYHVAGMSGSLVARTYNPGTPYTVQATTTPTVRPGVTTQVQGIVTSGQPVRFNPVVVVDPSRSSVPVHSSYVTEGTLVTAEATVLGQSNQVQPASKPNASPRPSILRKRDNEGSPLKAQKNLAPVLAALSTPASPPSPRRPDSRGNGGISSGGSTTISATSSPGLGEGGEDSLPPIKQEPPEEGDKPPIEMSPRKKPRKQQLTGNELQDPKFSEDEMEFLSEEKIKKEIKEVPEESEEKVYIPKRPNMSLINSYRHTWKSRHNHFLRYSDVKPKDERRPTVSDLANQKQVLQKLNGWKVYHLSTQMEDMSDLESQVFERLTSMLKYMERRMGKDVEKDVNRVVELIKGNIQRSKVISDQMQEAKLQVMKVFEHKSHVTDIISRCANKRALKKREKS